MTETMQVRDLVAALVKQQPHTYVTAGGFPIRGVIAHGVASHKIDLEAVVVDDKDTIEKLECKVEELESTLMDDVKKITELQMALASIKALTDSKDIQKIIADLDL